MRNHESKLRLLIASRSIPRSACSASLLTVLQPLLQAGVLQEERAAAGRRLVVCDTGTLNDFLRSRFPDATTEEAALSRMIGVARYRNSKALASDTPEIAVIRAWQDTSLDKGGRVCDAVNATAQHGVFSFLLRPGPDYQLHGPCALVENPAVFVCFERLGLDVGLIIHGRGRASQQLIKWLANQVARDFSLLHLPDYDPIGMDEFKRLRFHLKDRVRLHVPVNLENAFTQFSKRSLLDKKHSRALLSRLRSSRLPEIQRVVALIDRHNGGLEQEALLVSRKAV
jgi:hypothetical protein